MARVSYTAVFEDLVSGPMARMAQNGQRAFGRVDDAQDRFQRHAVRSRQGVDNIASSFGGLTRMASGLLAGLGLVEIGRGIVNTEAKFARFEAVLTNSLGDNGAARQALGNLESFAASTPFQIDELTDSFVKFVNRGFKPTMSEMTNLGDLASSTGKSFDQLTEAILDAQTGEFERLKEFGIRASKSGDQVAFTFKGVTQSVKFTDEEIRKYLISLGTLNGVQGSMAAISATTGGKISNLGDQVTSLYKNLGEALRPQIHGTIDLLAGMVTVLGSLATWLKENQEFVRALGVGLLTAGGIIAAFRIKMIALNLVMSLNPFGLIVTGIAAMVAGIYWAWESFEGFRGFLYGLWESIKVIFHGIKETVMDVLGGIGNILAGIFTGDWEMLKSGMKSFGKGILKANPVGFAVAYGEDVAKGYGSGFDKGIAAFRKSKEGAVELSPMAPTGGGGGLPPGGDPNAPGGGGGNLAAGIAGVAGDSRAARNVTISVGKLIESLNINTTNLRESGQRIQEEVTRALLTALNDVNIASG